MSMINASNVVNLNSIPDSEEFSLPVHTPELIKSAKRIADKRIDYLVQVMFDHVDDCLFEYADKAENNQVQSEFFDAMRIIRLKKEQMVKTYTNEFSKEFVLSVSDPSHVISPNQTQPTKDIEFEGLSLVEEDDLEESLAINNMTQKIFHQFKHPLFTMARRVDFVMGEVGYTSEENPLSPYVICNAFLAAVDTLELNIKIKLIVFKLFDKFVVQKIGVMYDEMNSMFIAAGVLLTIKFKAPIISRNGPQARGRTQEGIVTENQPGREADYFNPNNFVSQNIDTNIYAAGNYGAENQGAENYVTEPGVSVGSDPFALIQQLLINQRQGIAPSQGSGYIPVQQQGNPDDYPSYVTQEVITGLSGLQQSGTIQISGGDGQATAQYIKTNLVQEISRAQGDTTPKSMERAEADTIDIVSMMFDYILADSNIPEFIKTQIILLQIPMVKVAILDKTFFAKKNHPARLLLNELAYIADTLDEDVEPENDPIFQQIECTVARVLSEFESNVELFEELLDEFKLVVKEEVQTNKLAEELVEQTKETVAAEIELRLGNNRIPKLVRKFILGPWKDVLKIVGVRDECEGSAWDISLQTMDDLVWSVQPKLVVSDRQRLIKLIPKLLNSLQDGLILVNFGQDNIDELFNRLEKLHVASLRLDQITTSANTSILTDDKSETRVSNVAAANKDADDMQVDDILAEGSRHNAYERALVDPAITSSEYYQFVLNMELGTWLEFKEDNKSKRGKLSWKCDFTGDYTFTDRKYQVVADVNMRDLITLLENKEAHYVDNIPVFDRAINSIVSSLKKCIDPSPNDLVVLDQ